jgi:hypothetical protein
MEVVECDLEAGVVALVLGGPCRDQGFGRDAILPGADHDGRAVAVLGTDVNAVIATQALEPAPDIGLHCLDDMTEVQWAVGVGQRAGDEDRSWAQDWSFTASNRPLLMPFL